MQVVFTEPKRNVTKGTKGPLQMSPVLSVSLDVLSQSPANVSRRSPVQPASLLTLLFEPRRRPKGKSLSPRPFCQQRQGLNIVDNITSIHFAFGGLLFFVAAVSAGLCGSFCGSCEKEMDLQINQLVLYTIQVYIDTVPNNKNKIYVFITL